MSYEIGQIRRVANQNQTYLVPQTYQRYTGTQGIPTRGYSQNIFYNFAIGPGQSNRFEANKDYYLRFTVKRCRFTESDSHDDYLDFIYNITLRLYKNRNPNGEYLYGEYQTLVNNIIVQPYNEVKPTNEEYSGYEFIFRPNDDGYRYLGFILARTAKDYRNTSVQQQRSIDNDIFIGGAGQSISLAGDRSAGDLSTINNILNIGHSADKIGIQTKPGTLICVNHEPIRVGRSGIYEVNNGVKVYSVGICAPDGDDNNNINDFILDYAYTTN